MNMHINMLWQFEMISSDCSPRYNILLNVYVYICFVKIEGNYNNT